MQSTEDKGAQIHLIELMKKIKSYMENDQMSTVVLIAGCDGKRVAAHRVVLAAASPYFEAMFLGSMRESQEAEITIGEVRGDILEMLVHYCYSGVIELNNTNVEMILATADLLQLNAIKANCSNLMTSQLDETNCVGILDFADTHNCTDLHERAQKYLMENFKNVSKGEEFQQLNAKQLGKLLASDSLNLHPEKEVFQCLMTWVKFDEINRKPHLPQLLPHVRLPFIDVKFIADHMDNIYAENGCQELIHNLYISKFKNNGTTSNIRARNSSDIQRSLICFSNSNVHFYNFESDKWSELYDTQVRRNGYAACLMGNEIVIAGGQGENAKSVEFRNLRKKTFRVGGFLNTGRHDFVLLEFNGFLYAMGGKNADNEDLTSVERYNPAQGKWIYVKSMPTILDRSSIGILGSGIYKADGNSSVIYCYSVAKNIWTFVKGPDNCNSISTMVEENDCLYVFCRSNKVYRYDKRTHIWMEFSCSSEFWIPQNSCGFHHNNQLRGALGIEKGTKYDHMRRKRLFSYYTKGFYLPDNVIGRSGSTIIGARQLPDLELGQDPHFCCIAVPTSLLP